MAVSSCSSSASASMYQGVNSSDPLQQLVSASVLKRSQEQDKQTVQDLVQSVAASSPTESPAPGEVGHSVNVYA